MTATKALVLAAGAFSVDDAGLVVRGRPSFERWGDALQQVRRASRGWQFLVGDLIAYGEDAYGEEAAQLIDAAEWDETSVAVYVWLAKRIPRERRRLALFPRGGIDQHMAVAKLAAADQVSWLERAAAEGWTVTETRRQLKSLTGVGATAPVYKVEVLCQTEAERDTLVVRLTGEGWRCRAK